MSDNSNIQNSLFEAMKIFSESAAANSGATLTIDSTITAVKDEAAGVYSVEYLGSTFEVHSNSNATYSVGDSVYVLVPDGDFTKEKIILGLISASASAYTNNIENGKNYYEVSDNLVDNSSGTIKLSSYATIKPGDNKTNITAHDSTTFGALINGYLGDYRTFKLSLSAKTSLAVTQQSKGNYGISLNIPIKETAETGQGKQTATWKTVYLETANFVGTPYRYLAWAPQEVYFTIDEQYEYDETRLPYYSYFCYDFTQDANKVNTYDIQLKDISLQVVNEMTEDETTGYSLFLKASQGEYYSAFYNNVKTITPTLKVNGKTTSLKKSAIYWFIEDTEVKADSEYYSIYGGYGWKCLNTKTNTTYNSDGSQTFDYITTVQTHDIDRSDVRAATRFKCVVVYNKTTLSSIITLKNLSIKESILLTSSKNLTTVNGVTTITTNPDNTYMKDTGYVDLSALVYYDGVTNTDGNRTKILYNWARYDKDGNYINDASSLFTYVANNKITTIDGKSYFVTQVRFPVNKVEELNTVYCTAKYIYIDSFSNRYEEQIGTAKIGIATSTEYDLNLNINGDNVIYKYDTNGNSPTSSSYEGPSTSAVTEITPLTYTITRADGSELTDDEYQFVKYNWKMPKSTISLFTLGASMTPSSEDTNYYYFEGYGKNFNLTYKITNRFSISKIKQAINLTVTFQGTSLTKSATISFLKEGMGGSNGTAYTALLVSGGTKVDDDASVPYGTLNAEGIAQKLKFVYNSDNEILYRHNYNNNSLEDWSSSQKQIYSQVWRDGTVLEYDTHYDVEYSMFDDKITNPCFTVKKTEVGGCLLLLKTVPTEDNCNIVQAKITISDGNSSVAQAQQIIYAYYPIEVTIVNYDTKLIPSMDGGFSEVIYASDGTNPSYDETDNFNINDDTVISTDIDSAAEYFNITWESQSHLGIYTLNSDGLPVGKKQTKVVSSAPVKIKPDNKYDDGNSKNFVRTILSFDSAKESDLNAERATCVSSIDTAKNLIAEEENNLDYIKKTVDTYNSKVESWYSALTTIKPLLEHETNAEYALQKLQNDVIAKTQEYIQMQEKYNEQKTIIKEATTDLQTKIDTLQERVDKARKQLQKMDGTSGAAAQDLISLEEYGITLTETEVEELKSKIGQEITNVLKIDIDRMKEQIANYQVEYTLLQQQKYQAQLDIYSQIKTDLQSIANQIPNSAFGRYVNFKSVMLAILSEFDDGVSYDYLFKKLQLVESLFYSIAVVNNDHTVILKTTVTDEYNTNIATYNDTIVTDTNRITVIDNILATKNHSIIHVRPIILYFNRYEMSNINAWDGNKIETGETDTYLLAPQVGAGIKEDDNSFTGLVMGIKNTTTGTKAAATSQVGMFGYNKGSQSIKLDARTGAAIFGVAGGGGQIIIDPSSSSGLIYSSNYWKDYNKTTGMPSSYNQSNVNAAGMLINFSEPSIQFGSGYFTVDNDGNMHAGGGGTGDVGGWNIYDTALQSNNYKTKKNGICLDAKNDAIIFGSSNGKIYSGEHISLASEKDGFYLSQDGLSIGSKAKVTSTGVMYLGTGAVKGTGKHWTIDGGNDSYIAYGTTSFQGKDKDNKGVYIGTNGISLSDKFSVNSKGTLESIDGHIGGWTIGSNSLTGGKTILASDGTITCNKLIASTSGSIGGWTIGSNSLTGGKTTLASDGTLTCNKLIAESSGSIGGWTINNQSLSNGTITLDGAQITSKHFTLDASGVTLSSGGTTISSGSGGTTTLTSGKTSVNNGSSTKSLQTYVGDIVADKLTANDVTIKCSLNVGGDKYYLKMGGDGTNNPSVSGLNIGDEGIAVQGSTGQNLGPIQFVANITDVTVSVDTGITNTKVNVGISYTTRRFTTTCGIMTYLTDAEGQQRSGSGQG